MVISSKQSGNFLPMKGQNNKKVMLELTKEINFLKNVFSIVSLDMQIRGENNDPVQNNGEKNLTNRARNITELQERLDKLKSQNKFNLKTKLVKKSLTSKINKKMKKHVRTAKNIKSTPDSNLKPHIEEEEDTKTNSSKPTFNNSAKIVFSKLEFANVGTKGKTNKTRNNPKKNLEILEDQEEKFRQLQEKNEFGKVKELKEKIAWKNSIQKAQGLKIKDDPVLLKKSIKKKEEKKKHSKKQWVARIKNVEQKKEERQKQRRENITKKKKEKKTKIVKSAIKRGRVVL